MAGSLSIPPSFRPPPIFLGFLLMQWLAVSSWGPQVKVARLNARYSTGDVSFQEVGVSAGEWLGEGREG